MNLSRRWIMGGVVYTLAVSGMVGALEFGPDTMSRDTLAMVLTFSTFPPGLALIGVYPAMALGLLIQTLRGLPEGDPTVHGIVAATTIAGAASAAVANVYLVWSITRLAVWARLRWCRGQARLMS